MASVTIYGASDDLIEVEGDLNEEFSPDSDDQETWLIFGDGSVVAIRYDDFGMWRITRPHQGSAAETFFPATGDEGSREDFDQPGKPAYSDILVLTGDLRWVIAAEKMSFHKIPERSVVTRGSGYTPRPLHAELCAWRFGGTCDCGKETKDEHHASG